MRDRQQAWLQNVVTRQKAGEPCGIYSICSANEHVLTAGFARASVDNSPLLIESTCNQVNQFGGYTGQTPAQFIRHLMSLATQVGFPRDRLIVGGDHLGPSAWRHEPAAAAMERAHRLVYDCVAAGYQKIHLDASMPLGDDDPRRGLPRSVAAARSAELAATAERAQIDRGGDPPLYVIGTEVPVPGGSHSAKEELTITRPAEVEETIALTRQEFRQRGLEAAWERVIAVVVQPGVEFSDRGLHLYEPKLARPLSRFIQGYDRLVYEAHSTDYQTGTALAELVRDHFAILKVGPALTFAFREAVFALSAIEDAWLAGKVTPSAVPLALEQAMMANPEHWRPYYGGDAQEQHFARRYSFSDRSRYYWAAPRVSAALQQLLENLSMQRIPLTVLSQYLPRQYRRIRLGELANDPVAIIRDSVASVLADYAHACGYARNGNGQASLP